MNPLQGRLVRLRAFEPEDDPIVFAWVNDPEVQEFHGTRYPRSRAQIRRSGEDASTTKYSSSTFAVEALDDGKLIGEVWIGAERPECRSGEVAITIGDKSRWGGGYGTDAMRTLCRFGFEMMNLHRIELHVFSENARARRSYQKAGFREEGLLRECVFKYGRYMDDVVMGMLEGELVLE